MQNLIIIGMAKLCMIRYLLSRVIFSYVWPHFTVKNATSLYGTRAYAKNALEDASQDDSGVKRGGRISNGLATRSVISVEKFGNFAVYHWFFRVYTRLPNPAID